MKTFLIALALGLSLAAPAMACEAPLQLNNFAGRDQQVATGVLESRTVQSPQSTQPTVVYLIKLDKPGCIMRGPAVFRGEITHITVRWQFDGAKDLDPLIGKRIRIEGRPMMGSWRQMGMAADDPSLGLIAWYHGGQITAVE